MSLPPLSENVERLLDAGSTSGIRGMQRRLINVEFGGGGIWSEEAAVPKGEQTRHHSLCCDTRIVKEAGIYLSTVCILRSGEGFLDSVDFLGDDAGIGLAGFTSEDRGVEVAAKRIGNHAVGYTVLRVALLHQRTHKELSIVVGEELIDLRLAGGVFGRGLVVSNGDPLSDGKVRQAGAHGRVTGDDPIEDRGITLREDHAFAAARGTADKVGVRRRFCVVVRDDLLGYSGDFSVREEGEIEIGLLVAHESEIEGARFCLVPCIGAGHRESAGERRLVACVVGSSGIRDNAIATSAALHHEVTIPRRMFGQCESKADAELLPVYALAAIDNAVDAAMRWKRANGRSAGIRRRDSGSDGNERGFGDFHGVDL